MTPGLAKQTFIIIRRASGIAKNQRPQSENIPRRIPTHQPSLDPTSLQRGQFWPFPVPGTWYIHCSARQKGVLPQATELDLGAMYPARRVSQTENWESITMMTVAAIFDVFAMDFVGFISPTGGTHPASFPDLEQYDD